jgi:L,D-transpeptidase-like protein/putative peptidoglycan binding protein
MKRSLTAALALVAVALPGAAYGQGLLPGTTPAPKPKPKPQAGKMSLKVVGGLATRRLRYVMRGQKVKVVGSVRPFVAGQAAIVELLRRGRVKRRYRVPIRRARKGGYFVVRFRAGRRGVVRVQAGHRATAQQKAFRARGRRFKIVVLRAGQGAHGTHVLLLQRGLRRLGYATPVTGLFDGGTARAVTAFRKVNNMGRNGYASRAVYFKVFRHKGRFKLRHPGAGAKHVEFDWSRQVLVLARGSKAWRTYHASSGKASTPTVFGSFRFYSKQPGTNSHGMVHSNYFIGGYAVHGYPSVPNYPASHGCIRIPIPNAWAVNRAIDIGEQMFVYR